MSAIEEVRAALMNIPVSWLHMPALAMAEGGSAGAKKEFGPKIAPAVLALGAAAAGTIVGGGLQLAHQYLDKMEKSKAMPNYQGIDRIVCTATFAEIEQAAIRVYEEAGRAKGGNILQQIIEPPPGAKVLPALPVAGAAAAFIMGVYAGANAARD